MVGASYSFWCPSIAEHVQEARQVADEIRRMRDRAESLLACWARVFVGAFLLSLGERQEAEGIHRELHESARFARLPIMRYLAPTVRACYQIMDGQLEEAAKSHDDVLRIGIELGAAGIAAGLASWSERRLSGHLGWGLEGLKRSEERAEMTGLPVNPLFKGHIIWHVQGRWKRLQPFLTGSWTSMPLTLR
jgi:hypothetical protein